MALPRTYRRACEEFDWDLAWDAFDGTEGAFNLGHEVVGKRADSDETAVRIVDFDGGGEETVSFAGLSDLANRFANFLDGIGIARGDRVAAMMEPRRELYATIVGTWLGGRVYVPLYTLFGPEALNYRLEDSDTRVLVTTPEHAEKVDRAALDALERIVVVDGGDGTTYDDVRTFAAEYDPAATAGDDLSTIQYTSGTTGPPKGVEFGHSSLVSLYPYAEYAADFRPDDVFLGAAPPAWSYGLFFCTAYALHYGIGTTALRGQFDPERFVDTVERYGVTNLFAPPTAFRQVAQLDLDVESRDFSVRHVYSGGESVGSETVAWSERTFGVKIHEHYGFTEGSMLLANYPFEEWEIEPGSMGKPIPGFEVDVLDLDDPVPVDPGETGEIAVRQGAQPRIAYGYLGMRERSERKFGGEWIRSDDLARRDEDGYFWYVGRADDVIISSGYRIGPSEVEDSLLKHDAVAEVGVVGLPDEERGQIVAAFVVPADDATPSDGLAEGIQRDVGERLSKHEYPRRVEFVDELPKTASGKIQRYKLREEHADA